jgi:hypothetical protein
MDARRAPPLSRSRTHDGSAVGKERSMTIAMRWMVGAMLLTRVATAGADDPRGVAPPGKKHCSETATAAARGCANASRSDYWTAVGTCINVADAQARAACTNDARTARREADQLCKEQLAARRALCGLLGEGRYDPDFDPARFDADPTRPTTPNPFFPVAVGYHWDYLSDEERVAVEVTPFTKLIDGVTCLVVTDRVSVAGQVVEDTEDWYARAKNGDLFYCGEQTAELETFAGDVPVRPEVVSIEGAFKAGRDGAQAGVRFRAHPTPGEIYRQEFALGTAEDAAQVITTTYAYGQDADLDRFVPRALAELLCAGDCVVTQDTTPIEPDALERKYQAPGIGTFLEVDLAAGSTLRLVGCSFDARCAMLPAS